MNKPPQDSGVSSASSSQPAEAAFNFGMAALILTIFGFTWLGWGFSSLESFRPWEWIVFYLATLLLLALAVKAVRRGKKLTRMHGLDRRDFWSANGRQFRTITILEGIGCGIVVLIAILFHRMDLLAAGISLVVGIHFLPLAKLLHFRAYYVAGVAIIVCDLLSVVLFKASAITLAAGTTTGAILWLTALYAVFCSRRSVNQVYYSPMLE